MNLGKAISQAQSIFAQLKSIQYWIPSQEILYDDISIMMILT